MLKYKTMRTNKPKPPTDEERAQDLALAKKLTKAIKVGGPGTYFSKRMSAPILDYISSELSQSIVSVYIDENGKLVIIAKYSEDYLKSIDGRKIENFISGASSKFFRGWSKAEIIEDRPQNHATILSIYHSIEGDTEQILRLLLSEDSPIVRRFPVLFDVSVLEEVLIDKNGRKIKFSITGGRNVKN